MKREGGRNGNMRTQPLIKENKKDGGYFSNKKKWPHSDYRKPRGSLL